MPTTETDNTSAPTQPPIRTGEAVRRFGCAYWQLVAAIRSGKLAPPAKDSAGSYIWFGEDLAGARPRVSAPARRTSGSC